MPKDSIHQKEAAYLERVLEHIRTELSRERDNLDNRHRGLAEANRDMYENTAHHANDFDRLTEISQHLSVITSQTAAYGHTHKRVEKLEQMLESPYFGRFDFQEQGSSDEEKIYVGLGTLMDPDTYDIYIYDWRSPIAGIYYQYEPGPASYEAPDGTIQGTVTLKRQYRIRHSKLEACFDSNIQIRDEVLQEVLSHNASPKMRNIVETIQREQDLAIRDTESDLLLVQGVAGSGKTSIALHRVAFLLYEGLSSRLTPENILILSPNAVFDRYIAGVLPGLGENPVVQSTLELMLRTLVGNSLPEDARLRQTEAILTAPDSELRRKSADFKGSETFRVILDRMLDHAERRMVRFEDIWAGGQMLFHRSDLKNEFLHNPAGTPPARRLNRIESRVQERLKPARHRDLLWLTDRVEEKGYHPFDFKSYGRLLARKKAHRFNEALRAMTTLEPMTLYRRLMTDRALLCRLAKGLALPDFLDEILAFTAENLDSSTLFFEDAAPLAYLKLKLEGSDHYPGIRQVVIDEAQDYDPLHYQLFQMLFPEARFTVVGDLNQTIVRQADPELYGSITRILSRSKTISITLNTSYRTSLEISRFTDRLAENPGTAAPIARHGRKPRLHRSGGSQDTAEALLKDLNQLLSEGLASAAVITKTRRDARRLAALLKDRIPLTLIDSSDDEVRPGVCVIPVYLAKGLEFDAALVVGADEHRYRTETDRRLLYVACTRGLHQLNLYCSLPPSPFIAELFDSEGIASFI